MSQADKRAAVEGVIQKLNDDLSKNTLSDPQRRANLEQLKVYGRDPTGAEPIYSKSGLKTLSEYGFGTYSSDVCQEALRVIANALLLQPSMRVALIELNGPALVAKLYQNQDNDFEFLGARILFLCTYTTEADFSAAFSAKLIDSIEQHLTRHAANSSNGANTRNAMEVMAMNETTKLIFNIKDKCPKECEPLNAVIPSLCTILESLEETSLPLEAPTGPMLNALACLDFGAVPAQSAYTQTKPENRRLLSRLNNILSRSLKHYKPIELDTLAMSLLTILRMLYDTSSAEGQAEMRRQLLPADSERDLPLGQSSSLASQLLRLTTLPGLSNLPEAVAGLMFEMSDKDATTFIRNIGYGYAAGYLMTHNIPIPNSIRDAAAIESSTEEIPINPVTGQRLDREPVLEMPEMTEEEKEQEAERLFVLFERLRATGVVSADNPVRQAMEQGRLEEVSDNDSD